MGNQLHAIIINNLYDLCMKESGYSLMVQCNDCEVPPLGDIIKSVDMDTTSSFPIHTTRVDCLVYYDSIGTFLIECKTSYIKRAVKQFEECSEYLKSNWKNFVASERLPSDTPFPKNFILVLKNGIGREKYTFEVERNTYRLKIKGNGYQKVNNSGNIQVYTGRDLMNMKRNLHRFGGL